MHRYLVGVSIVEGHVHYRMPAPACTCSTSLHHCKVSIRGSFGQCMSASWLAASLSHTESCLVIRPLKPLHHHPVFSGHHDGICIASFVSAASGSTLLYYPGQSAIWVMRQSVSSDTSGVYCILVVPGRTKAVNNAF